MGMGVCALRDKAAPRKHRVWTSSQIDIGRFTQEPSEACPLTHSPRVLPIGPVASTVLTNRKVLPCVHDCRSGQRDWMASKTGFVGIRSAPARSAAVRAGYYFLNRPRSPAGSRNAGLTFQARGGRMRTTVRSVEARTRQ